MAAFANEVFELLKPRVMEYIRTEPTFKTVFDLFGLMNTFPATLQTTETAIKTQVSSVVGTALTQATSSTGTIGTVINSKIAESTAGLQTMVNTAVKRAVDKLHLPGASGSGNSIIHTNQGPTNDPTIGSSGSGNNGSGNNGSGNNGSTINDPGPTDESEQYSASGGQQGGKKYRTRRRTYRPKSLRRKSRR